MHVTRRCQKHHFLGTKIWYLTPFFIWECDVSLQTFYPFIDLMHKINLHCPKCMFKGKLLNWQCWRRPLVHLKRCHFLILCSSLLKIVANCAKMIVFNNNTQVLCRCVEICRKIKTALPVYFLLPLSIYYRKPNINITVARKCRNLNPVEKTGRGYRQKNEVHFGIEILA